ncbi:MAG: propanediol/glycerol family dehydratase large subunit [Paracoccaceae bacterium]|nr:propanediol/glycerol family dehydratase large subunit [Paracoccaceae bacterium]
MVACHTRPLRLDTFAREDPANGFAAFKSPSDPIAGLTVSNGQIASIDGVLSHEFDMIDAFIADHHPDLEIAKETMSLPSERLAQMLVDMHVSRAELVRLVKGMTPAKLTDVVARLNALELAFAYSKIRRRKTPGNQAHVTNAKDDPLQLAADAAMAVGLGFDELETTMRVSLNAWSNALACVVGSGAGGPCFSAPAKKPRNCTLAWPVLPLMPKQYRSIAPRKVLPTATIRRGQKPF